MSGIYEIWKAYAMFIVETVMTCIERTNGLPVAVALGVLILPVVAIKLFLPYWAVLSIAAAIGLPMLWFLGVMFWLLFAGDIGYQRR